MSGEGSGGPRDPELREGESGSSTPEVASGGKREKDDNPGVKYGLLAYYIALLLAVFALSAKHLKALETAPDRDAAEDHLVARGGAPAGGGGDRVADRDAGTGIGSAGGGGARDPMGDRGVGSPDTTKQKSEPGGAGRAPLLDVLALVVLAGMLGGTIHGLSSMEAFFGRGSFDEGWIPYYVARPFVGAGMAVTVALLLGARLLGVHVDYATHPWVFVGWAIMAGLFSTPALKKFRELFGSMLPAKRPDRGSAAPGARAPLSEAVAPITIKQTAPEPPRPT